MANRAFPLIVFVDDNLTIKAAHMAIIGFSIEFSVLDIVVDKLYNLLQGLGVMTHIGNFHIGNSAAGGNLLELAFKFKLAEGIDFFAHIHMVGVSVVALVGYVLDGTEASLIHASEAVAEALGRGTVEAEAQSGLGLPFFAGPTQTVHNTQREVLTLFRSMAYALHQLSQLIEADIAQGNGGITVLKEFIDGFTLLQTSDGAILPMHGANIATHALQSVMTAHQGFIAQLQTLIQELPEFLLVALSHNADLGQVQGDNALIEAALELVVAVFVLPGREEAAAAHGAEHIALVIFAHFFRANIVRIHAFSTAFYG